MLKETREKKSHFGLGIREDFVESMRFEVSYVDNKEVEDAITERAVVQMLREILEGLLFPTDSIYR